MRVESFVIRLATKDDAADVTALIVAAYGHYVQRLGRNPQPMTDDYLAFIEAGDVHVVDMDCQIVGALVTQLQPDGLLVRTVAVDPARQRQGLGVELLAFAETIASEKTKNRLRLYTNEVMDGTVNLYSRLGYWETHREGSTGKQVIFMEKEVPIDRTRWYGTVVTDETICSGKARIAGTRLYLDILLSHLETGGDFNSIIETYPQLTKEQLAAMMGFVRDLVASKRNLLKSDSQ